MKIREWTALQRGTGEWCPRPPTADPHPLRHGHVHGHSLPRVLVDDQVHVVVLKHGMTLTFMVAELSHPTPPPKEVPNLLSPLLLV
jgi:hypothetical protein